MNEDLENYSTLYISGAQFLAALNRCLSNEVDLCQLLHYDESTMVELFGRVHERTHSRILEPEKVVSAGIPWEQALRATVGNDSRELICLTATHHTECLDELKSLQRVEQINAYRTSQGQDKNILYRQWRSAVGQHFYDLDVGYTTDELTYDAVPLIHGHYSPAGQVSAEAYARYKEMLPKGMMSADITDKIRSALVEQYETTLQSEMLWLAGRQAASRDLIKIGLGERQGKMKYSHMLPAEQIKALAAIKNKQPIAPNDPAAYVYEELRRDPLVVSASEVDLEARIKGLSGLKNQEKLPLKRYDQTARGATSTRQHARKLNQMSDSQPQSQLETQISAMTHAEVVDRLELMFGENWGQRREMHETYQRWKEVHEKHRTFTESVLS